MFKKFHLNAREWLRSVKILSLHHKSTKSAMVKFQFKPIKWNQIYGPIKLRKVLSDIHFIHCLFAIDVSSCVVCNIYEMYYKFAIDRG